MANDSLALELLADPTRRVLLDALAEGPKSVRALTEASGVSQPAVSQHLKKLRAARLVTSTPEGASNIYRFDPAGLASVREMLDRYWNAALAGFEELANEEGDTA